MRKIEKVTLLSATQLSTWTPWIVCLSAALFFFYEFIQSNMFSSLATDVMADFHISEKSYSGLSSIYFLANVIFLFPAGTILDRFSTKRVILISLGLCIIGTYLFSQASTYGVAVVCRFLTGIGSAFCFLACIRLASRWFPMNRLALATGVIVTFAMTGGLIAQTPLTLLIQHFNWRTAIQLDAALGLVIFALIAWLVKDYPAPHKQHAANTADYGNPISSEQFVPHHTMGILAGMRLVYFRWRNILCALYTSLLNMPIIILGAMAGEMYLTQVYQISRTEASYATSLLFIGTLIGAPFIGWLSDYLRCRRPLMIIGVLMALAIMGILLSGLALSYSVILLLFLLLGFVTSTQVLSYPLVAEYNPPQLTATAVSVISIMSQGGPVLYQNLFGFWLESGWDGKIINHIPFYSVANYHHALWIIPIGFIIALLAVIFLREQPAKKTSNAVSSVSSCVD